MPNCCCCCCPPAISALFCLWFRNGCSKASVAGALTFFPPQPSLYHFERLGKNGEKLPSPAVNDEDEDDDQEADNSGVQNQSSSRSENGNNISESSSSKPENPMAALSRRQRELQKSAKKKFLLDQEDAKNGVSYKYFISSEICPSHFTPYVEQMQALKIYNAKAKSYIATVIYRYSSPATADQPVTTRANQPHDRPPTTTAPAAETSITPTTEAEDNNSAKLPMTLIYSHGNATDIGGMSFLHCYLARALQLNVVMYDYSGYGESGGTPLERNTYSDIEAVYNYVQEHVANGDSRSIILYGQSVGSGPSCYLASKQPVGGLILHSPFTSGMRVLTPSRALACLDIFPNIDRVKSVSCPVMIIHGVRDEEVNYAHGVAMYNAIPSEFRSEPWWVPDRGHNDICEGQSHMNQYIHRLKKFISTLEKPNTLTP